MICRCDSGMPACAEWSLCGSKYARAKFSRFDSIVTSVFIAIGIFGTYLKAGKRKADANGEEACDVGLNEEFVTTRLLYGCKRQSFS